MKLLHEISPIQGIGRYFWFFIVGANGRYLSHDPNHPYDGMAHLYRVERGQPDAPVLTRPERNSFLTREQERSFYARQRWRPWITPMYDRDYAITPACGRLRTRSTRPHLSVMYEYQDRPWRYCPDCVRRGITGEYASTVQTADPWNQMDMGERAFIPDPVSGF